MLFGILSVSRQVIHLKYFVLKCLFNLGPRLWITSLKEIIINLLLSHWHELLQAWCHTKHKLVNNNYFLFVVNYQESCGSLLAWTQFPPKNNFSIFCVLYAPVDSPDRFTQCRDTLQNLPLWDNYNNLLANGGNFGCIVSQNYPDDNEVTSFFACQYDYQQNAAIGDANADHLTVCIRFPYEGIDATAALRKAWAFCFDRKETINSMLIGHSLSCPVLTYFM